MIKKNKNGLEWLEYEIFADCPRLKHAVFLRGNSEFNLGERGEERATIENRAAACCQVLGIKDAVRARGIHGQDICVADKAEAFPETDGLSTNKPGLGLLNTHADCQVALFYDPVKHVLANVHSGWRGSSQNIFASTVEHMQSQYGCQPKDILVGVSPSLGPENAQFIHYEQELPKPFWDFQVKPLYFDFWAITEMQLKAAGILPQHIEIARIDTYANAKDFFSYRRDKTLKRNGTLAALQA